MNVKLTITIPTYNRPDKIQAQVRRLLPQLQEGVTLLVRDNNSDNPVQSLFNEEELSKFSIIRNSVNIGPDANIAECIRSVDSGWVWTLSDDDIITNDAVLKILTVISEHLNCCYINFQSKREEETTGLQHMLEHLKIYGALGVAFFISDCVFNVDILKKSVFWYYNFLSTQIGQIFMVIKHIELSPEAKCFFSKESYIEMVPVGNWSPLQLITNSSVAVDKFYYCRKQFRPTLFVALANLYLTMLIQSPKSIINNWYYFRHIIQKFGLINLLSRNSRFFWGYIVSQFIPKSFFLLIKNKAAKKYNNRIRDEII